MKYARAIAITALAGLTVISAGLTTGSAVARESVSRKAERRGDAVCVRL